MSYIALIRRNSDGLIREYTMGCEWGGGEGTIWFWTEGNYGCDCNRHLSFQRAAGEEDGEGAECGYSKYTVLGFKLPDGVCIFNFDEDRVAA